MSYYINLVLDGVGITDAGVKAEVNGGLQVRLTVFEIPSRGLNTVSIRYGILSAHSVLHFWLISLDVVPSSSLRI